MRAGNKYDQLGEFIGCADTPQGNITGYIPHSGCTVDSLLFNSGIDSFADPARPYRNSPG